MNHLIIGINYQYYYHCHNSSFKLRVKVGVDSINDIDNDEDNCADRQDDPSKLLNFGLLTIILLVHHEPEWLDLGSGVCRLVVDLLQAGEDEAQERKGESVEQPDVYQLHVGSLKYE